MRPVKESTNRMVRVMSGVLTAALLFGEANTAAAQIRLIDLDTLPDLTVHLNAPAVVDGYDLLLTTIRIDNQAPSKGAWLSTSGNDVTLAVDFTGRLPQTFSSGSFTCRILSGLGGSSLDEQWNRMICRGFVPWGGAATIYVWDKPSLTFPCGRPTYADALVTTSGTERSTSNNRAIARTDIRSCL